MDEKQLQAMMEQIAQMISQGASPEEVLQQLVQAGVPQDIATQMVQAVVQELQGGQGQQPGTQVTNQGANQGSGVGAGQEALQVIQEAIQVVGAEGLAMILQAWDSLPQEQKQQLIQQLASASTEGQTAEQQAPQDNREQMLFGNY